MMPFVKVEYVWLYLSECGYITDLLLRYIEYFELHASM